MTSEHETREQLLVPVFPLPAAHLFPGGLMPLHVFEPRYREMVVDAVEGSRRVVMGVFRPGWEQEYSGRPAIYSYAGLGEMVRVERLHDGRWSLLLHGLRRVRILAEEPGRSYRLAYVEPLPPSTLPAAAIEEGPRLIAALARLQRADTVRLPEAIDAEQLADFVAMQLPIDSHAKQRLFETFDPRERARAALGHLDELLWLRRLANTRDVTGEHRDRN
ncbi:MAG: LON peptidase substrate-binding domain-containing protein [Planctomycetes bacterium]|nr:LON peptidase substrate-binding domain-containing protein [Planctomycetota bacterium]